MPGTIGTLMSYLRHSLTNSRKTWTARRKSMAEQIAVTQIVRKRRLRPIILTRLARRSGLGETVHQH